MSINTKDICNTIFYDKKKDIITTETVYTTSFDLEPNQKSPFEIMLLADEGKKIKSYSVNVESNEYLMIMENSVRAQFNLFFFF